jgi:Domain of unknown function (DUF4214)
MQRVHIMATQQQINDIAGLYVAYFDRAPDPAGLQFWIDQLDAGRDFATISQDFAESEEAKEIYPFLATPDLVSNSPAAFVTSIYANLFGRAPDQAGLNFWVDVLGNGEVAPGDMVEAIMLGAQDTLVNGQLIQDKTTVEHKIECALAFTTEAASTEGFEFNAEAYSAARQSIEGVDATDASVESAKAATFQYFSEFVNETTFTLTQPTVEVSAAVAGEAVHQTVLYWGYNPHSHDETDGVDNLDGNNPDGNDNNLTNEGPEDGGIPADVFFTQYFPAIASQNFNGVDGIDVDNDTFSIVDFASLEDINVSAGDGGNGGTITFSYSDGSADDIALGQAYYDFLCKLILDEEGNSRFFEKEIAARIPVYVGTDGEPTTVPGNGEPIGYVDAVLGGSDAVYAEVPIILTPTANNGSTTFPGFTSADDDTIVAGTLDILHGATLDGGLGYNTLEIDAKGHFAQPKALENIQQVTIQNLPNIYTLNDDDNSSDYPDIQEDDTGASASVIDLSRAVDLENVTITDGYYDYLDSAASDDDNNYGGAIEVVGLRNGASLTLDGDYYQDVFVQTASDTAADGFTVILNNVSAFNNMYIADNTTQLNLVSQGGGNNLSGLFGYNYAAVNDLVISGGADLLIENDLSSIFEADTPATIDASANTGGVDLNISGTEQVTFVGSKDDDRFAVLTANSDSTDQGPDYNNDQSVTITNADGDNYYDIATYALEVTDGDGDNNVEFSAVDTTITVGAGDNHIEGISAQAAVTAGDGDNKFDIIINNSPETGVWFTEDDVPTALDLVTGDGSNIINVIADGRTTATQNTPGDGDQFLASATINITAGDGGNLIQIPALPYDENGVLSTVTVNTGSGTDSILVGGSDITINSGGGSDTITLLGIDPDYATQVNSDKEFVDSDYGAVMNIDTGSGSATVNLGAYLDDAFLVSGRIVAMEGSSITGEDVTLFVNTHADLRAADLSGITSIVMDDDAFGYSGRGFPVGSDSTSGASSLTLLDTQVVALGEAVFSTQGDSVFGTQSVLTIVVTSDTSLSDLLDLSAWNTSVKLCFVVEDGVTLTMTAEELHTYVAPDGINVTNTNGYDDNQVIITNAGPEFDAFAQGEGTGAGTVADVTDTKDVTVIYVPGGFERPTEDPLLKIIEWNSDDTPVIDQTVWPYATTLTIEGDADLTVTAPVSLGDNFTIDFADFGGTFTDMTNGVPTLTVANFDLITEDSDYADWGSIAGNGTSANPVRIDMIVEDESTTGNTAFGVLHGGFFSSGVQQYVVAAFDDDNGVIMSQNSGAEATIVVCDNTEDLEVLGLQNNRMSTVTFQQVNWGTEILFEGDGYANASEQPKNLGNPDLSEVGAIVANFFEAGANAFVRITNQGVELGQNEDAEDGYDLDGERVLDVAGITVTNADRLRIEVEDGDAVVHAVNGTDVERVIVTGPEDVKLVIEGVDTGNDNTGLDSDDLLSIDGTGVAGEFSICFSDDADLSGVALTGIDKITLTNDAVLTLTGDQAEEFQSLIETSDGSDTELVVVEMGEQAIDFSAIDVDNIGDITFSDVDGTITVDPATDFGDADSVEIVAEDSDTTVQMTFAQFGTLDDGDVDVEEEGDNDATLALTDIPEDASVDLGNVSGDADVTLIVEDFVGAPMVNGVGFEITSGGDTVTLCVSGTSDLTAVELSDLDGLDAIELKDGATLTLTAEQLAELIDNRDGVSIADGATATLNVSDLSTEALDLDALVADNPGLSIGTVTIADIDVDITINAGTTFGGADVVTPTADISDVTPGPVDSDPADGTEETTITLSVAQYGTTSGSISGDALVNLTDLANNNDGDDADILPDTALLDTSGITAPHGTITLAEEGASQTSVGETVTLNELTDISGFEIVLTDGQLIRFSTEAQADGATVTESDSVATGNPTGVVWLFTTVSGPLDTSNYDSDLNTLFVDEDLVNGANEEELWTTLSGNIVVEKFNDEAPNALVVFNRINTFEAFGAAPDGITFDDQGEFQTTGSLTLNLEGNVNLGDVTVDDTVGEAAFTSLTVNSYLDVENLPDGIGVDTDDDGVTDTVVSGITIQPNQVGDINLNAGVASGETVTVTLNTSDDQNDAAIANGTTGSGSGTDTDDGLDLEVGTISFGTPADGESTADLVILGDHDVSVEGIDISDAALTQLNVNVDGLLDGTADPELEIAGVNMAELAEDMSVTEAGGTTDDDDLDSIIYIQDLTADTDTDLNTNLEADDETILNVAGDNDLKAVTAGNFNVDGVYASAPGTLTLTAAQVAAIGITDDHGGANNGPDGAADNWVLGPGVNPGDVTINICGVDGQDFDLDLIEAAGFNIGTITFEADAVLGASATLGGADEIILDITDAPITLEMTAAQFNGFSGVITENRTGDAANATQVVDGETEFVLKGTVVVDELEAIESGGDTPEVTIDLSDVDTSGDNTLFISASDDDAPVVDADAATPGDQVGDNDVFLSTGTDLGDFSITLWDVNDISGNPGNTADELAGQTIRFSTETQADGRTVNVIGADDNADPQSDDVTNAGISSTLSGKEEADTNVVWMFDEVTAGSPGLDVSGYSQFLGRVWIREDLVDSVGGDVDSLFTIDNDGTVDFTLSEDIIKRIEATDLSEKLTQSTPLAQRVEVTAFTDVDALEFEIDELLTHLSSLRIDLGGVTDIGDLEIDNIIGPVNPDNPNFPGDDDFGTLTINSLLANSTGHYLLPDEFDPSSNALPSDTLQFPNNGNVIGDISSGDDRGVLGDVVINLGSGLGGAVDEGVDLSVQTVFFSDDGTNGTAPAVYPGDPSATLDINGANDVVFKSLDTSDADITSLTIDTADHTGTVTVTGGSPAFDGGDATGETEILTITNAGAVDDSIGIVNFGGSTGDDPSTAGTVETDFFSPTLDGNGDPYAGIAGADLSLIDTSDHGGTVNLGVISLIDGDGLVADGEGFHLFNDGNGLVTACIGEGNVDGTLMIPELLSTGEWVVTGGGVSLEIKDVVLNAGGKITLDDVDVCITGDDVSLAAIALADLTITGGTTIKVAEGGCLTITVEQAVALDAGGLTITGSGTLKVVGNADDATDFGSALGTAFVDLSGVTLTDADGAPAAGDEVLNVSTAGAIDDGGTATGQNIIGSDNDDVIIIVSGEDDTITGGLGDDHVSAGDGNDTYNVDAGTDTIQGATPGTGALQGTGTNQDVIVVTAGATADGIVDPVVDNFTATADTTNDGTGTVRADAANADDTTIDMSLAGGANGWNIIGNDDAATAADVLIGSDNDDIINGGNTSQTADAAKDTLTGNDGADVFEFEHEFSDPDAPAVSETTAPVDEEVIDLSVDVTDGGATDDEGLVITIAINGVSAAYAIDLSGVDVTDDSAITAETATQLNAIAGLSASVSAGNISLTGDDGNSVAVLGVAPTGTTDGLGGVVVGTGSDTAEISTITIDPLANGVEIGEVYSAVVTLADGTTIGAEFEATVTDDEDAVAAGLKAELDLAIASVGGTTITTSVALNVITITDSNADNGGFTLTADVSPAVIATGASLFGATGATFADNFVDSVTDFLSGEDKIDLNADAGVGSATNYMEAGEVGSYGAAFTAASGVIDDTVSYYMTSTAADGGLLFFDADGNGSIDGVVNLVGLDEDSFDFGDIIA